MKHYKLNEMVKGWFVGDFEPTVIKTDQFEVGVKYYSKGDVEPLHHHKVATELTVVVSGSVEMFGRIFVEGDIIEVLPGESTSFKALMNSVTVVVKRPSIANDKYLGE